MRGWNNRYFRLPEEGELNRMTKKLFFYVPVVIKRIQNEEKVLKQELCGYKEYTERVHYRLAPLIW